MEITIVTITLFRLFTRIFVIYFELAKNLSECEWIWASKFYLRMNNNIKKYKFFSEEFKIWYQ